jgi:(p)ppGpp synthase/HD superfamily hydrolase
MTTTMITTLTPILGDRFETALLMAHRLHRSQERKGFPVPYISHLMSVAALVLEEGGNEDEAIAALLHDAIEDQGGAGTRELLRVTFGDRVCAIIDGCTESQVQPKPAWRERKERHLAQLVNAPPSVLRVTIADKLHNIRSLLADYDRMGEQIWSRFGGGKVGTIWYYREMLVRLRSAMNRVSADSVSLEEFAGLVDRLEQL